MSSSTNGHNPLTPARPQQSQPQQQSQQQPPQLPPSIERQSAALSPHHEAEEERRARHREQAMREADQVLGALGQYSHSLDHFNLLGVIANPHGSHHGQMASAATPPATSTHGIGSTSSGYMDPSSYLESTISSVTEQIEALNHVFEDWSRQYLEDYYYADAANYDAVPETQLQELPPELVHMDLASLQGYLQLSGELAESYKERQRERRQKELRKQLERQRQLQRKLEKKKQRLPLQQEVKQPSQEQGEGGTTSEEGAATTQHAGESAETTTKKPPLMPLEAIDIPESFFQTEFDLTDPQTFCELLLTTGDEDDNNGNRPPRTTPQQPKPADRIGDTNNNSFQIAMEQSTHELFQLPPPDHFTGYLDKVELALLEQVRDKSDAFFLETNRFAQLKAWVEELLLDVQHVRTLLDGQAKAVTSWQHVPSWDRKRRNFARLERILEGANEVLRSKQCIGGLLSAKDDLGAVEQIQYARKLLAGTVSLEDDNDGDDGKGGSSDNFSEVSTASRTNPPIELGRLHALRPVGEQLNQYQSLVVTNLTEEVVEKFLEWNSSNVASIYGMSTGSNGGILSSSRAASQQELQRRTLEIIQALSECRALSRMSQCYSTRLHDVVRMTVRTTVGEFASDAAKTVSGTSVSVSVSAMTLERFIACLDMLFEQLLALLTSASAVDEFCQKQNLTLQDEDALNMKGHGHNYTTGVGNGSNETGANGVPNNHNSCLATHSDQTPVGGIVASAAELSSKSVAELLRLRKEVHSMLTLQEMRQIWDTCTGFIEQGEKLSGHKGIAVRSMLLAQAKGFVERKHESHMSALVAALDSERWTQCEVSAGRQAALDRLCSGRAGVSTGRRLILHQNSSDDVAPSSVKKPDAEVEGVRYKVVWSCLLLVEMVMTNIEAAAHFQNLASNVVGKVAELLRLFNSRTTQLVLGAGAIHSAARLKSINAKHLSLVTQCLGIIIAILPHVRAALMSQLPQKQHTLLSDIDRIKKEFMDHNEKVLNKFVTIIGGIVEHGLAPRIGGTNFDLRANNAGTTADGGIMCCVFLDGVLTNTRKMHQVLCTLLPPDHLQDVFSRIFAFVDQKMPDLFIAAAVAPGSSHDKGPPAFHFPTTVEGKKRLLDEVKSVTTSLNGLEGVYPWDFSAETVLAKKLEYELPVGAETSADMQNVANGDQLPRETDDAPEDGSSHPTQDELNWIATACDPLGQQSNLVPGADDDQVVKTAMHNPDSIETQPSVPATDEDGSAGELGAAAVKPEHTDMPAAGLPAEEPIESS